MVGGELAVLAAQILAHSGWIQGSIINAGDGTHEHPTQALLDTYTIRKRFHGSDSAGKGLDGLKVAIVGDILHSRVARSNLLLLNSLGAEVHFVAPPTLLPSNASNLNAELHFSLDETLAEVDLDVVMMLRIQSERMNASYFPSEREYARIWGFNAHRLSKLKDSAIVMHPGPMNRGVEMQIDPSDVKNSLIHRQVANGVSVRMAVLFDLLGSGANLGGQA